MKTNEYYECYDEINNTQNLIDIIKGNNKNIDFREKCIFRGLENSNYLLEPSSLRNNGKELNKFISQREMLPLLSNSNDSSSVALVLDKNFNIKKESPDEINNIKNYIQKWKEINVILKFISIADKNGLKVNIDERIRRLIDLEKYDIVFKHWPNQILWENIALAQHYGTPTIFLDWSYEYKAALYFAVKDILEKIIKCQMVFYGLLIINYLIINLT